MIHRTNLLRAALAAFMWAASLSGGRARGDEAPTPFPDSLVFSPPERDDEDHAPPAHAAREEGAMPRAPFGEGLITDPETWQADRDHRDRHDRFRLLADYNRVDRLRLGGGFETQQPGTFYPRFGSRIEYAFQRERILYGLQLEQPIADPERFALGFAMVRRTDHNDLQQVSDVENSLALLFGRQDYRDYFEREGFGAYVAVRVPGVTTLSVHARNDDYRTLPTDRGTRSFFERDRKLRDNPPIVEGQAHTIAWRLEYRMPSRERLRPGTYHWIELERAGRGLGGDFEYTRLLADVRSVLRLSPATTLAVRAAAGHAIDGDLPPQRRFVAGGVDGLRAHEFGTYQGNQFALAQTEYTIGLWQLRSEFFQGGLHAIVFTDVGRAWQSDAHRWDVGRQRIEADGGFGISTSEDNLRVYFAKNLRQPSSDFVVTARLQRPF